MFAVSKSLRAIAGALALSAICASALAAETVVAITSFVEHPALDAVRDGTKDELIAEGFEPGKNLKWD
ncbi:ABC transporter substrate binding protein, partial [Acinetobacter baumannii]